MKKEIILAMLISIMVLGCSTGGNQGTLVMRITDAPSGLNIEKALVTISGVQVHIAASQENDTETESGWTTIVEDEKTFDLIKIKDAKEFLGSTNLTAGKYTQVRLSINKALVTIDGTEYDLKVPSGKLKLVHGFDIEAGKTTNLLLDFDAQESIVATGKEGYNLKPTIKLSTE